MSEATTLAAIEAGMTVGEDGDSAVAANGQSFVSFVAAAIIPDDVALKSVDAGLEQMVVDLVHAKYGVPPNPPTGWTIYWRVRPGYETQQTTEGRMRRLRCRLVMDKP